MVCACTHLTAFSALFVPNGDSCGGVILFSLFFSFFFLKNETHLFFFQGWKWGTIQSVAISLLGLCIVVAVVAIILEHYYIHLPMLEAYTKAFDALEKNPTS